MRRGGAVSDYRFGSAHFENLGHLLSAIGCRSGAAAAEPGSSEQRGARVSGEEAFDSLGSFLGWPEARLCQVVCLAPAMASRSLGCDRPVLLAFPGILRRGSTSHRRVAGAGFFDRS